MPLPEGEALAQLEDFRITHPTAIGSVLRQLMSGKYFLTVECSNRPHRIVTRILDVDPGAGVFIFDSSNEQIFNRSILESEKNNFSALQDGIRVQFVTGRPEQHKFEGGLAFRAQIPQSLYRMQRRGFFRAAAPLVESYRCTASLPDGRQVSFDVFDLSLNGVGLRSKDPTLGELPIGAELSKAVLDFRDRGTMETDLKITNLHNIRGHKHSIYHLGCRFERFPKSKEPDLQRLVTYLELARRGRRS